MFFLPVIGRSDYYWLGLSYYYSLAVFAVHVVLGDGEGAHDVAVALYDVLRNGPLVKAIDDRVGA